MEKFKKATGTTGTGTLHLFKIYLKLSKSTTYSITDKLVPEMQTSEKAQNPLNYASYRCQKTCVTPIFYAFPCSWRKLMQFSEFLYSGKSLRKLTVILKKTNSNP